MSSFVQIQSISDLAARPYAAPVMSRPVNIPPRVLNVAPTSANYTPVATGVRLKGSSETYLYKPFTKEVGGKSYSGWIRDGVPRTPRTRPSVRPTPVSTPIIPPINNPTPITPPINNPTPITPVSGPEKPITTPTVPSSSGISTTPKSTPSQNDNKPSQKTDQVNISLSQRLLKTYESLPSWKNKAALGLIVAAFVAGYVEGKK